MIKAAFQIMAGKDWGMDFVLFTIINIESLINIF